jgi:quercetin dioxygenase-like cupin family protein
MQMTVTAKVLRPGERPLANRGGGAKTIPMVTPGCGSQEMLNGFTMFEPGARIALHFHNCEESVLVVEGAAIALIGGQEYELQAGDVTWVPAEVPHFFRNASSTQPMKIFWTYASIEATRTLVETGETRPVSAEHAPDKLVRS